jgi:phosphohistidine phosphatase
MIPLLLVRHAIALDRDEAASRGVQDPDRPLTAKGAKKMQAIAAALHTLVPTPALLLSSPFLRTRQTATILGERWDCPVRLEDTLAPGGDILHHLQQLVCTQTATNETRPIVLIGHEPDLSELAGLLLFGEARSAMQLKKGGAALLGIHVPLTPGSAILQWLMTPKSLLALHQDD